MLLNSQFTVSVHLGIQEFLVVLSGDLYRFRPFDLTVMVDPENTKRYCYGLAYQASTIALRAWVNSRTYECTQGLLGRQLGHEKDCRWINYTPDQEVFKFE